MVKTVKIVKVRSLRSKRDIGRMEEVVASVWNKEMMKREANKLRKESKKKRTTLEDFDLFIPGSEAKIEMLKETHYTDPDEKNYIAPKGKATHPIENPKILGEKDKSDKVIEKLSETMEVIKDVVSGKKTKEPKEDKTKDIGKHDNEDSSDKTEEKSELDLLKEEANELGIKYRSNIGINTLKKKIKHG